MISLDETRDVILDGLYFPRDPQAWMECTKEELCDTIVELSRDLAAARREIQQTRDAAAQCANEYIKELNKLNELHERLLAAARRELDEERASL